MVLIFGGAYQGKLDYAKKQFSLTEHDCFSCNEENGQPDFSCKLIDNFDKYILYLVKNNIDSTIRIKQILPLLQDKIIIINDISSGVVPMDKILRKWREEVGRCTSALAAYAQEVTRVFCGIPTKMQ